MIKDQPESFGFIRAMGVIFKLSSVEQAIN